MMNLAQAGGGIEFDPALLPKSRVAPEEGWQWQAPSSSVTTQPKGMCFALDLRYLYER